MSKITIAARLDEKGSELSKYNHFVFGRLGASLSGGFYLHKEVECPKMIVIELPGKEKEGDDNA